MTTPLAAADLTALTPYALAATVAGLDDDALSAILDDKAMMFDLGPAAEAVWAARAERVAMGRAEARAAEATLERILTTGTADDLTAFLSGEAVAAPVAVKVATKAAPVAVKVIAGRVAFNLSPVVAAHLDCVAEAMPEAITMTHHKTTTRVSANADGAAYLAAYLIEVLSAEELVDTATADTPAKWAFALKAAERAYSAGCATLNAAVAALA